MRLAAMGVGVLLAAVAVWLGVGARAMLRDAERAPGVVVALNAGGSHPEIAFAAPGGETLHYPQGGLIFGYQKGDAVTVLYQANNPRGTATILSFGAVWGEVVAAGLGAVALLLTSALGMIAPRLGFDLFVRGR